MSFSMPRIAPSANTKTAIPELIKRQVNNVLRVFRKGFSKLVQNEAFSKSC